MWLEKHGDTMQEVNLTGNGDSVVNTEGLKGWGGWLPDLSMTGAARMVGVGLVLMVILAILAEVLSVSILLAPEDTGALESMREDGGSFGLGVGIYAAILVLDALVAWALYVAFRPVHEGLAKLMATLRLLYTAGIAVSLGALAIGSAEAYIYGFLTAYVFFITHILVLGYLVYVSGYVHRALGTLLVVASFGYVFLTYGTYALPGGLNDAITPIVMVPATLAEISLGIWLLVRAGRLPATIETQVPSAAMAQA